MTEVNDRRCLSGLRVLVVEDMVLVALDLTDQLTELGCKVIGPVSGVSGAFERLGETEVDGAILDINLAGETSAPVAEWFSLRDIPFIFITGYDSPSMLPDKFQDAPRFSKPIDIDTLTKAIDSNFHKREDREPGKFNAPR